MENAIQQTQSFEERMMSRVKESIGDMITDEELKKIVERGIEKAFFEPRIIKGSYSYNDAKEEPLATQAVREFAKKKVDEAITKWMEEHQDKMATIIEGIMRDSMGKIMLDSFASMFGNALINFRNEIQQVLQR